MARLPEAEDSLPTADHTIHGTLSCLLFVGAESHRVELPRNGKIVFGRGSDADVRVVADGVSRRHTELTIERGAARVSDLGSKNGTHVNGRRIEGPTALGDGDEVRLGEARLLLSMSREQPPGRLNVHAAFLERVRIELARARAFSRPLALLLARSRGPWGRSELDDKLGRLLAKEEAAGLLDETTLEILVTDASAGRVRAIEDSLADGSAIVVHALLSDERSADAFVATATAAFTRRERSAPQPGGPVVADPKMREVYAQIGRVARGRVPVLVLGETGAGKELVAREIHRASGRTGKLVSVNAAALPEALLESELFGHERGAFTGANAARQGLFEAAHGGTLFLDEVGEMPAATQAKLLRVLEEGAIRRLGATDEKAVDVRVVAATNADLERACEERRFRRDLLFRLRGCVISVPPLRERPDDLEPIAEAFLARASGDGRAFRFSAGALAALRAHPWPGNVRELRHVIERAVLVADPQTRTIEAADLALAPLAPSALRTSAAAEPAAPPGAEEGSVRDAVRDYEREQIERALEAAGGNVTRAAEMLKLPRKTLAYRLEKLGIKRG